MNYDDDDDILDSPDRLSQENLDNYSSDDYDDVDEDYDVVDEDDYNPDNRRPVDPREDNSIEGAMRSYIEWDMDLNSPLNESFNSFDNRSLDPFNNARKEFEEGLAYIDPYNPHSKTQGAYKDDPEARQQFRDRAISAYRDSVARKYSYALDGTYRYDSVVERTFTSLSGVDTLYKPPRGFVSRPVLEDWITWQESNRGLHSKEAVFQVGETTYVQGILARAQDAQNLKTDLLMQGFSARTVMSGESNEIINESRSAQGTRTSARILFQNEITKQAINRAGEGSNGLVNAQTIEFDEVGSFHPKMGYFYDQNDVVQSGYIGTQNRTASITNRSTLEDVMFFHMDMVKDKGDDSKNLMKNVLGEIKLVTDALFQTHQEMLDELDNGVDNILIQSIKPKQYRERLSNYTTTIGGRTVSIKNLRHIKVNEDVHIRRLDKLKQFANRTNEFAGINKGKVIISIEYLESKLFKPLDESEVASEGSFDRYRKEFIDVLKGLRGGGDQSNRLVITMSASGIGEESGLFSLFDRIEDGQDFGMDKRELLNLLTSSVSIVPTQKQHSKTVVFMGDKDIAGVDLSSANMSYYSYTNNVEAGIYLTGQEMRDLGMNTQEIYNLYENGAVSRMSNEGLMVERRGNRRMVNEAIGMLKRMGGVDSRSGMKTADLLKQPFVFSRRYNANTGDLVGLDIKMKDRFSFSVTVGEMMQPIYDKETGKHVVKKAPVLYINKGNRVITGMTWVNRSTADIYVNSLKRRPEGDGIDSDYVDGIRGYDGDSPNVVKAGAAMKVDALQVLGGLVYTLGQGLAFERTERSLYHALDRLFKQGQSAVIDAIKESRPELTNPEDIKGIYNQLQNILTKKDSGALQSVQPNGERLWKQVENIVTKNSVANTYYTDYLRSIKKDLFKQLTEIYPQLHELSYGHGQLLHKRPIYGIGNEVENIHFGENDSNSYFLEGFLLSDYGLQHGERLYDKEGNPLGLIRSVADTGRAESSRREDMVGGLMKVKGGTSMPLSLDFMNAVPGLSMISYKDYKARLERANISGPMAQRLARSVFALEIKRVADKEGMSVEALMNEEALGEEKERLEMLRSQMSMLYFGYPKMEQIVQRLKNLKSVRPFLAASKGFRDFAINFGLRKTDRNMIGDDGKIDSSKLVGGQIALGLSSAQFAVVKQLIAEGQGMVDGTRIEHTFDTLMDALRRRSADLEEPLQGYIENRQRVFVNTGISEMSDFSYFNSAAANEEGLLRTQRVQAALDLSNVNKTGFQFNAVIRNTLKAGTIFVARNTRVTSTKQAEVYNTLTQSILQKVNDTLIGEGKSRKTDFSQLSLSEVRSAVQELRKEGRTRFIDVVNFRRDPEGKSNIIIEIKKGVYTQELFSSSGNHREYNLKQIGTINEGNTAFTLTGISTYTNMGNNLKKEMEFRLKNYAFSGRDQENITVLTEAPVSGIQDNRSNMVTYNFAFASIDNYVAGQRTADAKGPLSPKANSFFTQINDFKQQTVGLASTPNSLSQKEVFAVIASKQMKSFLFKAGLAFLEDGKESNTYKYLMGLDRGRGDADAAGYRIAEALSLLMLSEEGVLNSLKEAYTDNRIQNRRQAGAVIDQGYSKRYASREELNSINNETLQKPTLAIYEGLMSLIDERLIDDDPNVPIEQALIKTVENALKGGEEGALARESLVQKTRALFDLGLENEDLVAKVDGKIVGFNETQNRSIAILAFLANAARDLLTDIDMAEKNRRIRGTDGSAQQGLLELGYTLKSSDKPTSNASKYAREIVEALTTDLKEKEVPAQLENKLRDALSKKDEAKFLSLVSSLKGNAGNKAQEILAEIYNDGGFISSVDRYKQDKGYRDAVRAETAAVGIYLPEIDEEGGWKENSSMTFVETAIKHMRAMGQTVRFMELPFDMMANKITVPTGTQDTTSLEGHYANALSQRQLDLYTETYADKEKAASMQQTLVAMGSMINYALGRGHLNLRDIKDRYSLRIMSVMQLASRRDLIAQDNTNERTARRYTEATNFSLEFGRAFSYFSSRSRINPFANQVQSLLNTPLSYQAFHSFITAGADTDNYVRQMRQMRTLSSGITNLSKEERLNVISEDYFNRIISPDTALNAQARDILSPVIENIKSDIRNTVNNLKLTKGLGNRGFNNTNKFKQWLGGLSNSTYNQLVDTYVKDETKRKEYYNRKKDISHLLSGMTKQDVQRMSLIDTALRRGVSLGRAESMFLKTGSIYNELSVEEIKGLSQSERKAYFTLTTSFRLMSQAAGGDRTRFFNLSGTSSVATLENVLSILRTPANVEASTLKEIIRNEVGTKLSQAINLDPGKEYIQSKQILRQYAQQFKRTLTHAQSSRGLDSNQAKQLERVDMLLENIEKTHMVSVPVLLEERSTEYMHIDERGQESMGYKMRFSNEKGIEGVILGLDIMERLSLVFPEHSHEALLAQHELNAAMERAQRAGLYDVMRNAALNQEELILSQEQREAYNDLARAAMRSTEKARSLTDNTDSLRKAMGDRLSMSGASYIAMSSWLLTKYEAGAGQRLDRVSKANTGSGLKTLLLSLAANIESSYMYQNYGEVKREYRDKLNELKNIVNNARRIIDPSNTELTGTDVINLVRSGSKELTKIITMTHGDIYNKTKETYDAKLKKLKEAVTKDWDPTEGPMTNQDIINSANVNREAKNLLNELTVIARQLWSVVGGDGELRDIDVVGLQNLRPPEAQGSEENNWIEQRKKLLSEVIDLDKLMSSRGRDTGLAYNKASDNVRRSLAVTLDVLKSLSRTINKAGEDGYERMLNRGLRIDRSTEGNIPTVEDIRRLAEDVEWNRGELVDPNYISNPDVDESRIRKDMDNNRRKLREAAIQYYVGMTDYQLYNELSSYKDELNRLGSTPSLTRDDKTDLIEVNAHIEAIEQIQKDRSYKTWSIDKKENKFKENIFKMLTGKLVYQEKDGEGSFREEAETDKREKILTRNELIKQIMFLLGVKSDDMAGLKEVEDSFLNSMMLVARQGAPSGTYAAYGTGLDRVSIEKMYERAQSYGSSLRPDRDANTTGLYISAVGDQFTQLGDYDGDSFQAVISKMASKTREVAQAQENLNSATRDYQNFISLSNSAQDPAARSLYEGKKDEAYERIQEVTADFIKSSNALSELQQKLRGQATENIRNYIEQLVGLPTFMMQGAPGRSGAIRDEYLPSLIKQYRDTQANFYENQKYVNSSVVSGVAKLKNNVKFNDLTEKEKSALTKISNQYGTYGYGDINLKQKLNDDDLDKLLEFSAVLTNTMTALNSINDASTKIAGSLINEDYLHTLQAVIGATGSSLLGKTYNTVVPLLGMAMGDIANVEMLSKDGAASYIGSIRASMDKSISKVSENLVAQRNSIVDELYDQEDLADERREKLEAQKAVLDRKLALLEKIHEKYSQGQQISIQGLKEEANARLNSTFSMMLTIQQFLRDAALKPKKSTSLMSEASKFSYDLTVTEIVNEGGVVRENKTVKPILGLGNVLDQIGDDPTERSKAISAFVGAKVGFVLNMDMDLNINSQTATDVNIDYNELRAFSVLEMTNEYLSGKYTAEEMLTQSAFKGFLSEAHDRYKMANPLQTADMTVQTILADTMARFQSNYRYDSILETDDYDKLFSMLSDDIVNAHTDAQQIESRINEYRTSLEPESSVLASDSLNSEIDKRVDAFRDKQYRYKDLIKRAHNIAEQKTRNAAREKHKDDVRLQNEFYEKSIDLEKKKTVVRLVLEQTALDNVERYKGEGGMFSSLIALNSVIKTINAEGEYAQPGLAKDFELAQQSILMSIGRGKIDGANIHENIARLASHIQNLKGEGSDTLKAQALSAFMAIGGDLGLPGMREALIEYANYTTVTDELGGQTVVRDESVESRTQKLNEGLALVQEIMTTDVNVNVENLPLQEYIQTSEGGMAQTKSEVEREEGEVKPGDRTTSVASLIAANSSMASFTEKQQAEITALNSTALDLQEQARQARAEGDEYLAASFEHSVEILDQTIEEANRRYGEGTEAVQKAFVEQNIEAMVKSIDEVQMALKQTGAAFTEGEMKSIKEEIRRDKYKQFTAADQAARRSFTQGGLTSLLAMPLLFAAIQGDIPLEEQAAAFVENTVETAATLATYEGSQTRQLLLGELVDTSFEERRIQKLNSRLQFARAKQFMRSADTTLGGAAQAAGYEAMFAFGSALAAEGSKRVFRSNIGNRLGGEVGGAILGMALANIVGQRPIVGTDAGYDDAWRLTAAALGNIWQSTVSDSIEMLQGILHGEDIEGEDTAYGEDLDADLYASDFRMDMDYTELHWLERINVITDNIEGEELIESA